MAMTHVNRWLVVDGKKLTKLQIVTLRLAVIADIKEARPKAHNKQSMPRCENCGGKLVTTCVNKKCDWSPVT